MAVPLADLFAIRGRDPRASVLQEALNALVAQGTQSRPSAEVRHLAVSHVAKDLREKGTVEGRIFLGALLEVNPLVETNLPGRLHQAPLNETPN